MAITDELSAYMLRQMYHALTTNVQDPLSPGMKRPPKVRKGKRGGRRR